MKLKSKKKGQGTEDKAQGIIDEEKVSKIQRKDGKEGSQDDFQDFCMIIR